MRLALWLLLAAAAAALAWLVFQWVIVLVTRD
jgi:hypothetical protein